MASHPHLFRVEKRPGNFNSSLRSLQHFKRGEVVCQLAGLTVGPRKYSSVQCGDGLDDHVELNSDLLYVNHSCDPNVAFDLSSPHKDEWHAKALKEIVPGETMTFFYPSTEWSMEQPFDCTCGYEFCLGRISGASSLPLQELKKRGFINDFIVRMVDQRDGRPTLATPMTYK